MRQTDDVILRFFRDDIGGILVTNEEGYVVYEDEKSAFIRKQKTNWKAACPLPHSDQRGEIWDLVCADKEKTYMVITSTFIQDDQ